MDLDMAMPERAQNRPNSSSKFQGAGVFAPDFVVLLDLACSTAEDYYKSGLSTQSLIKIQGFSLV